MTENNKNVLIDTSSRVNNIYLDLRKFQIYSLVYSLNGNTTSLNCVNGQIIRYCLSIYNTGPNPIIYNIKVTDTLSSNLSFIPKSFYGNYINNTSNLYYSLYGTPEFNSIGSTVVDGKTVGGTIEWTIPALALNTVDIPTNAILYFDCEVVANLT